MRRSILALLLLLAWPRAASSQSEFVVIKPGEEGSTRQARGIFGEWAQYLREKLRLPENGLVGTYYNTIPPAIEKLNAAPPTFGIVGIDFFLAYRGTYDMKPILSAREEGDAGERYHVLTRPDGPGRLEDLAGRRLVGKHVAIARFVTVFVLGGKLDAERDLQLAVEKRTPEAAKKVLAGEADAIVVTDRELQGLKDQRKRDGAPEYASLRSIHVSEPVPTAVVVTFGQPPDALTADALVPVLRGMVEDPRGKEILGGLRNAWFEPLDEEELEGVIEAYEGEPRQD